jgi:hypothetical protein
MLDSRRVADRRHGYGMLNVRIRPDEALREVWRLPADCVMDVWRVLRMLRLLVGRAGGGRRSLFVPEEVAKLEEAIRRAAYDQRIRDPIAGSLHVSAECRNQRKNLAGPASVRRSGLR